MKSLMPSFAAAHLRATLGLHETSNSNCSVRYRGWPTQLSRGWTIHTILFGILTALTADHATATTISYSGTLASSTSIFEQTFTLSGPSNVTIETFGFGGGTDLLGNMIAPGGFDPLIALFSGNAASASILTDGAGNPLASADTLSNFVGNCPPAGFQTIGTGAGSVVCGDVILQLTNLPAGVYTLFLSDANYIPLAVSPGPPVNSLLSDGFADLTGGVLQVCNFPSGGLVCVTPTGSYAVDVSIVSASPAPEPARLTLLVGALVLIACLHFGNKKPNSRERETNR